MLHRAAFSVLAVASLAGLAFADGQLASSSDLTLRGMIAQDATAPATPAADPRPAGSSVSDKARFVFGPESLTGDREIFWKGFLNGMRGFEHFYNPIGNPLYFETPQNQSGLRPLFLHHRFADDSQLQGGHVNVYAMQARLALTDRLTFIATKDGWSDLDADILPEDQGWNDIAAGAKYLFIADRENDFLLSGGFRWMFDNGDDGVLQSGNNEFSPFVSLAKGFDAFHVMANITPRIPTDGDDGNDILQWDLHLDYEILPGFAPMFELHGLHYLSDGDRFGLSVGGLDYTNLGSSDVSGSTVIWGDFGARVKFNPNFTFGAAWGQPFTNQNADIMGGRLTIDFELLW